MENSLANWPLVVFLLTVECHSGELPRMNPKTIQRGRKKDSFNLASLENNDMIVKTLPGPTTSSKSQEYHNKSNNNDHSEMT